MKTKVFTAYTFFVSYVPSDRDFVIQLADSLKSAGINLWVRDLDIGIGKRKDHLIEEALKECETLIAVLSKKSVVNKEFRDEVATALDRSKKIIPILIEVCEVPRQLNRIQYIDYTADRVLASTKLLKAMALAGHSISDLGEQITKNLSEGELLILQKKEQARKLFERDRRNQKIKRNLLWLVVGSFAFLMARMTYGYIKSDETHFNEIYDLKKADKEGRNFPNKNELDAMERHRDSVFYCQHHRQIEYYLQWQSWNTQ